MIANPEPAMEVFFGQTKFTLLEPLAGPQVVWLAVETDNPNAKPRFLVLADCTKEEPL